METIQVKKENLKKIVEFLEKGMVLICPTDTVYGLICDAKNEKAVERIFEIKQREKTKPLAVFVKNIAEAKKIAIINESQKKFLQKNWPGPTTIILKARLRSTGASARQAKKGLSKLVYKENTIGIRIPDYYFINLILKKFKNPLAQTSANISGQPATIKIKEVLEQFSAQGGAVSDGESAGTQPDVVINAGDLPENNPSKVVDFSNEDVKVLRC